MNVFHLLALFGFLWVHADAKKQQQHLPKDARRAMKRKFMQVYMRHPGEHGSGQDAKLVLKELFQEMTSAVAKIIDKKRQRKESRNSELSGINRKHPFNDHNQSSKLMKKNKRKMKKNKINHKKNKVNHHHKKNGINAMTKINQKSKTSHKNKINDKKSKKNHNVTLTETVGAFKNIFDEMINMISKLYPPPTPKTINKIKSKTMNKFKPKTITKVTKKELKKNNGYMMRRMNNTINKPPMIFQQETPFKQNRLKNNRLNRKINNKTNNRMYKTKNSVNNTATDRLKTINKNKANHTFIQLNATIAYHLHISRNNTNRTLYKINYRLKHYNVTLNPHNETHIENFTQFHLKKHKDSLKPILHRLKKADKNTPRSVIYYEGEGSGENQPIRVGTAVPQKLSPNHVVSKIHVRGTARNNSNIIPFVSDKEVKLIFDDTEGSGAPPPDDNEPAAESGSGSGSHEPLAINASNEVLMSDETLPLSKPKTGAYEEIINFIDRASSSKKKR